MPAENTNDSTFTPGLIGIVLATGASVVLAEGVETVEQLEFLRSRGCHSYQGYLRSRPVSAADFAALLRAQGAAPVTAHNTVDNTANNVKQLKTYKT